MARIQDIDIPYLGFDMQTSAITAPADEDWRLYARPDGFYAVSSNASVGPLAAAAVGGDVATDTIWDAAGDLAVGSGANTAARLAIGNAGGYVSRINGVVTWNSGTANPTGVTGDRFYRTDVLGGTSIIYDGTRWVSEQIYQIELKQEQDITAWPLSANSTVVHRGVLPFGSDFGVWLMDWHFLSYVITTNTGANYWDTDLRKYPTTGAATVIATVNTSADSPDVNVVKKATINALMGSNVGFYTDANKAAGTPGNWRFMGGHVTCRIVVT